MVQVNTVAAMAALIPTSLLQTPQIMVEVAVAAVSPRQTLVSLDFKASWSRTTHINKGV
jgi:hypothetical protein